MLERVFYHMCKSKQIFGAAREFCPDFTNFPEKYFKKVSSKKSFACQFGRHYFQMKPRWAPFLLRFSGSLRRFSEILPGFYVISPGFSSNQNFGAAVAPPAPLAPTPVCSINFHVYSLLVSVR